MYLGQIVEIGKTEDIFAAPYHPYTQALLSAVPDPDRISRSTRSPSGAVPFIRVASTPRRSVRMTPPN